MKVGAFLNLSETEANQLINAAEAEWEANQKVAALQAELDAARAKIKEEEAKTTPQQMQTDESDTDDQSVSGMILAENYKLKDTLNEIEKQLVEAGDAGCLADVLKVKGFGFIDYGDVENFLKPDGLGRKTINALVDAMADLVVDSSFEIFERREGKVTGANKAEVITRLSAAIPQGATQLPSDESLRALAKYFIAKKREIEEVNPSGGYTVSKLWDPDKNEEQPLPEAVKAVVQAYEDIKKGLDAPRKLRSRNA